MFEILDDTALPSLADLVTTTDGQPHEDELIEIGQAISRAGLPVEATMGVGDGLRGLIDRVRGRKLVREEPEAPCSLPWFECHVPPGGTTTVTSTKSESSDASGELSIYGSGIGAGRRVTIEVSASSPSRSTCATYALDCMVRARVFEVRGRESVEVSVTEVRGESLESLPDCPRCGIAVADVDPFDFELAQHIDLRHDTVPSSRSQSVTIEGSLSATIGIPSLGPVALNLGAKVSRTAKLDVLLELAPGRMYQPYRRLSAGPMQTPMWAVEPSG